MPEQEKKSRFELNAQEVSGQDLQALYDMIIRRVTDPTWLFSGGYGLTITDIRRGFVEGEVVLEKRHGNPIGSVHGGLYMTLADNLGGAACVSCASGSFTVTTVATHMNFLSAPHPDVKKITARAAVIKEGHRVFVVEIRIYDDADNLLTTGLYEYMRINIPE